MVRELRYVFCFVVHVALNREYLLVKGFELSFLIVMITKYEVVKYVLQLFKMLLFFT